MIFRSRRVSLDRSNSLRGLGDIPVGGLAAYQLLPLGQQALGFQPVQNADRCSAVDAEPLADVGVAALILAFLVLTEAIDESVGKQLVALEVVLLHHPVEHDNITLFLFDRHDSSPSQNGKSSLSSMTSKSSALPCE